MFYNINWAKSKVYARMHIIYKMKRRTGYCTIQMSTIILSVFKNLINIFLYYIHKKTNKYASIYELGSPIKKDIRKYQNTHFWLK